MPYREQFTEAVENLASAFGRDDASSAAGVFAFPTLIRSSDRIDVFDTPDTLIAHFKAQLQTHRKDGVTGYRVEIGDVFGSGPVGLAEAVWRYAGASGPLPGKTRLWYHMVDTSDGWRIESVRTED